jgi:hypothetical protein
MTAQLVRKGFGAKGGKRGEGSRERREEGGKRREGKRGRTRQGRERKTDRFRAYTQPCNDERDKRARDGEGTRER